MSINLILFFIFSSIQNIFCTNPCYRSSKNYNQAYSKSKNFYLPHSFMSGSATDLLQQKYLMNPIYDHVDRFLQISTLVQYQQSVDQKSCRSNLGSMAFWSGTNTMTFGNNNGKSDLDIYQFGLGDVKVNKDGIAGTVTLDPLINQVGADFLIYYMREKDRPGFYFKIHAPISSMTMQPYWKEVHYENFPESAAFHQVTQPSEAQDPATSTEITYYDWRYPGAAIERSSSVGGYWSGASLDCARLDGNPMKPIRLHSGRLLVGKETVTKFAEFALSLGYNWIMEEKGFFGTALKCSYPTGNLAAADFMLEPIVGRSGLLGIGLELTGKYRIWENSRSEHAIDFWMNGEILHLIPIRKPNMRSFDLKLNGKGSKYMLVQNYGAEYRQQPSLNINVGLQPQVMVSAVNITTLPVLSSIDAEGSFAAMFEYYHHKGMNFSAGVEIWGRTSEHLQIDTFNAAYQRFPNLNDFAVVGRQHASYLIDQQDPFSNPVYTYYCEPAAKVNKSQDPVRLVGVPPSVTVPMQVPDGIADARDSKNRVPAKIEDALDIDGACASAVYIAKLFAQVGYAWKDYFYVPSIGLSGSIEFAPNTNSIVPFWALGGQFAMSF